MRDPQPIYLPRGHLALSMSFETVGIKFALLLALFAPISKPDMTSKKTLYKAQGTTNQHDTRRERDKGERKRDQEKAPRGVGRGNTSIEVSR